MSFTRFARCDHVVVCAVASCAVRGWLLSSCAFLLPAFDGVVCGCLMQLLQPAH